MSTAIAATSDTPGADALGTAIREKLAGFARALRDNGFKIGLAETGDALAILASPAATRPSSLKPAMKALFCATRSDWQRFDEIFDAYWRGRGMRRVQTVTGTPGQVQAPQRRLNAPGA